ncbi:MAG TPA: hypothetical protein VJ850_13870 [Candidatus Limnocylindrales bacterium]|nr:hypothetical protein [Candidatus Limnocylindrales bacterium]
MTVQGAVLRALRKPRGTAAQGFGKTSRTDNWAIYPVIQALVFTICAGYLTFSGVLWGPLFGPQYVKFDGYLSPLFSPLVLFKDMPTWLSPGLLILWIPIGFRATCYYYRKAYYRFYFADPAGCAVGEPTAHRKFALENALPFILQNLHRYMLYLAFIPLTFLWLDILPAFNIAPDADVADPRFRVSALGVLFLVNVILLTGYSLSCHSLRHLVGGRIDCFSCTAARRVRYTLWQRLTDLNRNHMWWAWCSLITVTLADVYARLFQAGIVPDFAIHFG